tara:strand:- start:92 stop:781 length:690 start_codon:yes stop_codon:yes gene_type:complete
MMVLIVIASTFTGVAGQSADEEAIGSDVIFCLADANMTCSSESNYLEATIAPGETFTFVFVLENKGDSDIEFTGASWMMISGGNESRNFGFMATVEGWGDEDDVGEVEGGWETGRTVEYSRDQDSEICDGCILRAGESKGYMEKSLTPGSETPPGTYKFWVQLVRVDDPGDWDWEYANATIIIHVEAEESGLPGFGAWAAMIAFISATGIHSLRRRERFNRMGSPSIQT